MNVFTELWFWLLLFGLIIFLVAIYYYSTYHKKDVPLWVYLWMGLGIFTFFIGSVILIWQLYRMKYPLEPVDVKIVETSELIQTAEGITPLQTTVQIEQVQPMENIPVRTTPTKPMMPMENIPVGNIPVEGMKPMQNIPVEGMKPMQNIPVGNVQPEIHNLTCRLSSGGFISEPFELTPEIAAALPILPTAPEPILNKPRSANLLKLENPQLTKAKIAEDLKKSELKLESKLGALQGKQEVENPKKLSSELIKSEIDLDSRLSKLKGVDVAALGRRRSKFGIESEMAVQNPKTKIIPAQIKSEVQEMKPKSNIQAAPTKTKFGVPTEAREAPIATKTKFGVPTEAREAPIATKLQEPKTITIHAVPESKLQEMKPKPNIQAAPTTKFGILTETQAAPIATKTKFGVPTETRLVPEAKLQTIPETSKFGISAEAPLVPESTKFGIPTETRLVPEPKIAPFSQESILEDLTPTQIKAISGLSKSSNMPEVSIESLNPDLK